MRPWSRATSRKIVDTTLNMSPPFICIRPSCNSGAHLSAVTSSSAFVCNKCSIDPFVGGDGGPRWTAIGRQR